MTIEREVRAPEGNPSDRTPAPGPEWRLRELTALHEAAHLLQEDRTADEWLEAIVAHLPTDWLAPEIVAARILLGEAEFTSGVCPPAPVWQRVEFVMADGAHGAIEIALVGTAADGDGPSGETERALLCSLADLLRIALDRRQAQEALRESYERIQELTDSSEAERAHLARELHDEVGQGLTAIRLLLSAAQQAKARPAAATLKKADAAIDDLMKRVREMSITLRPPHLDILGLPLTVSWHTQCFTEQTGVRVVFRHRGIDRRFAPRVELAAFRIVQESLTNVARHAGVARATVSIWANDALLFLQIEDKGKGFDPATMDAGRSGVGLLGMQERACLLGGALTVESAPGAGTTIRAELPLGDATPRGEEVRGVRRKP